jgi:cytochrome c peroxidase
MSKRRLRVAITIVAALMTGAVVAPFAHAGDTTVETENEFGVSRTINVGGFPVNGDGNEFFLDLGVNGRRCVTCHQPDNNLSVTPASLQQRFRDTHGTDPIFRTNDGSNSPLADVSTVGARRQAYSMLLTKGVIRVGISIPATAEFELVDVKDPYGYAGKNGNGNELSLFRRPLPTTNLGFLSTVMWDGRETLQKGTAAAIHFDLSDQANSATQGHAQAPLPITDAARNAIVAFEMGLFTAQVYDKRAGALTAAGAAGGPDILATQPFVFGVNDPLGCDPTGAACNPALAKFDPVVFTAFATWSGARDKERAAIARGEDLFNHLPINIKGVSGINDDFGVAVVTGTCTTCHDTPHAGNHSVPAPLNIGVAEPPVPERAGGRGVQNRFGLPVGDMPVYTLRHKVSGEIKVVTDPGRALITGKWKDVGRFKGPILRGLAGRDPYFHNGAAASLRDVVNFYDMRFELHLTEQQKADLVAFLRAL